MSEQQDQPNPVDVLKNVDYDKMLAAISERIFAIKAIAKSFDPDNSDHVILAKQLFIPAMGLLMQFHECVEIQPEAEQIHE